jgi:flagellar biosynthetic protein FliQ
MSTESLLDVFRLALTTAIEVGGPFVLAALVVGILASLIMAATQLQETALSFVPKLAALAFVLMFMGPWLLGRLTRFTRAVGDRIVEVGHGGRR